MGVKIQVRRDTAANWTAADPILDSGEFGYETTSKRFKIGDGITPWSSLPYKDGIDTNAVHKTGDETIEGEKTFLGSMNSTSINGDNVTVTNGSSSTILGAGIVSTDALFLNTPAGVSYLEAEYTAAGKVWTLPAASGTLALTSDIPLFSTADVSTSRSLATTDNGKVLKIKANTTLTIPSSGLPTDFTCDFDVFPTFTLIIALAGGVTVSGNLTTTFIGDEMGTIYRDGSTNAYRLKH